MTTDFTMTKLKEEVLESAQEFAKEDNLANLKKRFNSVVYSEATSLKIYGILIQIVDIDSIINAYKKKSTNDISWYRKDLFSVNGVGTLATILSSAQLFKELGVKETAAYTISEVLSRINPDIAKEEMFFRILQTVSVFETDDTPGLSNLEELNQILKDLQASLDKYTDRTSLGKEDSRESLFEKIIRYAPKVLEIVVTLVGFKKMFNFKKQ